MFTFDQFICHLVGDYILQSDWMANAKTKQSFAAICHALCYSLPFLFLRPSLSGWVFMVVTHFAIDRWRLARFLVYAKNFLSPNYSIEYRQLPNGPDTASPDGYVNQAFVVDWWHPWPECSATGYYKDRPAWLSVWLLIIADNTLHLICNGLAFYWF